MSIPGKGRNGPGEGEAPGREACQPGSGSDTLGQDGTGRTRPVLPGQKPCPPPFHFPAVGSAEAQAPGAVVGGVPQKPASSSCHSASWGHVCFYGSLLNCFEQEDPHVVQTISVFYRAKVSFLAPPAPPPPLYPVFTLWQVTVSH